MTRNNLSRLCAAALALLAVGSASACGGSAAASPAGPAAAGPLEKTHLTVGALAVNDDAPLYIAIRDGLFRRAGLTVTPLPVAASTQALPDMLRGTVDIMAGANYVSFLQAEDRGAARLKILADAAHCTDSSFQVLTLPGSGITGPSSLAGRSVAVNLPGNVQTLTLNSVLKANGVNTSSVRYAQVPFPELAAALRGHRVDAISAIEPYITEAEEQDGAVPVLSECTGPTADFPMSGYFATAAWAQKYPNTAKTFQEVINQAQALADSDQEAVRSILPTYTKISAQDSRVMSIGNYPSTVSATELQQVAVMMRSAGMLPKPLSVQSLVGSG